MIAQKHLIFSSTPQYVFLFYKHLQPSYTKLKKAGQIDYMHSGQPDNIEELKGVLRRYPLESPKLLIMVGIWICSYVRILLTFVSSFLISFRMIWWSRQDRLFWNYSPGFHLTPIHLVSSSHRTFSIANFHTETSRWIVTIWYCLETRGNF